MSSIVSQVKVNLHNICCGNGCHLTEVCWLRLWSRGNSNFTGSVKMVMMFAPCGDKGRPHHLLCLILLYFNFGLNLIYFIFAAMKA